MKSFLLLTITISFFWYILFPNCAIRSHLPTFKFDFYQGVFSYWTVCIQTVSWSVLSYPCFKPPHAMCVQIGSLLVFSYSRFKYSHNQILTPCLLSSFQFHSSFDMTFSVPDFLVYLLSQFPDSANGVATRADRQEKKLAMSWRMARS